MELQYSFLGLIASIVVLHLATRAGNWLRERYSGHFSQTNRSAAAQPERDDWYVFFHCADLLGREPKTGAPGQPKREQPADAPAGRPHSPQPSRNRARA